MERLQTSNQGQHQQRYSKIPEQKINFCSTKLYGPKYTKFGAFDKKMFFSNHFWQSVDIILEDISVAEAIFSCWTINLKSYHLSVWNMFPGLSSIFNLTPSSLSTILKKWELVVPTPSFSHSVISFTVIGGRTRLPKFKFEAKFPIGLHVILQLEINQNSAALNAQNYLNWKSIEVQPAS